MTLSRLIRSFSIIGILLSGSLAFSAQNVNLGHEIEGFSLPSVDGKDFSLAPKSKNAVAVVFIGTECPINNQFIPRLNELSKQYESHGVLFLGINSNRQDSMERVIAHAKQFNIKFPVLKDKGNIVADRFDAKRTPEAFLLDNQLRIRYRGRIDDQYGIGFQRRQPTRRDLADAIDEILAGKPVSQPVTSVFGCVIARAAKEKKEGSITFAKQVSRIVQKNCQECHRSGQIGPMALLTYEDVSDWAATIREVVDNKRMPPWHADARYGKFSNNRSLSVEDRNTLLAWIDQGCPKGDDADLPAPREFAEGWRIGKPDVVFTIKDEFEIPAKAPKRGIPYYHSVVSTNFDRDMWVQAVEAKPGAKSVVHHIIVFVKPPGKFNHRNIGDGFLVGYAPGDMPNVFRPGAAKLIPKGSQLIFQLHYTPDGTERTDRSSVALIFAKEPPKHQVETKGIDMHHFAIPPGADNHEVVSTYKFKEDSLLISFLPHMHLRGKSFKYEATFPDGREEVLLSVPRYDFSWQSNYRLQEPLFVPAGTKIKCTAHYDNSPSNPNNPDPKKVVTWGEQTWEEMMIGFLDFAKANPSK